MNWHILKPLKILKPTNGLLASIRNIRKISDFSKDKDWIYSVRCKWLLVIFTYHQLAKI